MAVLFKTLFYLISLLPFRVLYLLSDIMYFVFYFVLGFRKKVVKENLKHAFPDKSKQELQVIEKQFFAHLCDIFVESIKLFSISKQELISRCVLTEESKQILREYHSKKKSLVLVSGHCGNWEWVGSAYSLQSIYPLTVSFRPGTNSEFDLVLLKMRTRFGTNVISVNDVIRQVLKDRDKITSIGFISDQTPPKDYAQWLMFMNRMAPVYTGAEKIAIKFNYPMFFIHIKKIKRGHYSIGVKLIHDSPKDTATGFLTEAHTRLLESDLREQPYNWLWSHKRWKHQYIPNATGLKD